MKNRQWCRDILALVGRCISLECREDKCRTTAVPGVGAGFVVRHVSSHFCFVVGPVAVFVDVCSVGLVLVLGVLPRVP